MTLAISLLLALGQDLPVETLLQRLGDEDLGAREEATSALIARWKTLTDADLEGIRRRSAESDAEVASRAGAILRKVELRRRIPEAVSKALPDLFSYFPEGAPDSLADLIDKLQQMIEGRAIDRRDVVPVLIEMMGDDRKTSREEECWDSRRPPKRTVGDIANAAFRAIAGRSDISGIEDLRSWWAEQRTRPEKDWHLPQLSSPYEQFRREGIRKLAELKDDSTYPAIKKALASIQDGYYVREAIQSLHSLPSEVTDPWLKPYLADPRPHARLAAAASLLPRQPDAAVASVLEIVEKPEALDLRDLDREGFLSDGESLMWLASTKHPQAAAGLLRALRRTSGSLKVRALEAVAKLDTRDAREALLESMNDEAIYPASGGAFSASFDSPRVGDVAGMLLAERLDISRNFTWTCSRRLRDLNRVRIQNAWRALQHLPALALPAPVANVDRARLVELRPALTADDEDARLRGLGRLLDLGAGAWPELKKLTLEATGAARDHLGRASQAAVNAVRRVELQGASNAAAQALARKINLPLDVELLGKIGEEWFQDDAMETIYAELERNPGGEGIHVVLTMTAAPPGRGKPTSLGAASGGSFGAGQFSSDVMNSYWRERFLARFQNGLPAGEDGYHYCWIRLEKRWK